MGVNDRSLNVVGESFKNSDGTNRQTAIARCRAGEQIQLRREFNNRHDPNAVAVVSARGVQIGYVSGEHSRWIGGKLDKGADVRAIAERVQCGEPGEPSRGVLIRVNLEGERPDLPTRGWWARLFGR